MRGRPTLSKALDRPKDMVSTFDLLSAHAVTVSRKESKLDSVQEYPLRNPRAVNYVANCVFPSE